MHAPEESGHAKWSLCEIKWSLCEIPGEISELARFVTARYVIHRDTGFIGQTRHVNDPQKYELVHEDRLRCERLAETY